jgi:long-subunit fatty acid transport protein
VPTFGLGAMYRPTPALEFGLNFNWRTVVRAQGTASSDPGPKVSFNNQPTQIGPAAANLTRCAPGGTFEEQKICIAFQIPITVQAGGRYIFLDDNNEMKGDVELNVGWENWGKRCKDAADFADGCTSPGQFRVVVDSAAYVDANADGMYDESEIAVHLKENYIEHRFKNTYNVRLGGSYHIPVGSAGNKFIVRGGLGYDTRAAEEGWLRADVDGNSRVTTTVGGSYRTKRWEVMFGGGAILEGENTNGPDCNPTPTMAQPRPGCAPDGSEQPIEDRQGNDPVNPIVVPSSQVENPVNKGTFKSNYILFMLGFQTWF